MILILILILIFVFLLLCSCFSLVCSVLVPQSYSSAGSSTTRLRKSTHSSTPSRRRCRPLTSSWTLPRYIMPSLVSTFTGVYEQTLIVCLLFFSHRMSGDRLRKLPSLMFHVPSAADVMLRKIMFCTTFPRRLMSCFENTWLYM